MRDKPSASADNVNTTGVPNSRFEESIDQILMIYLHTYRVRHHCLKCAVLCYTILALYKALYEI